MSSTRRRGSTSAMLWTMTFRNRPRASSRSASSFSSSGVNEPLISSREWLLTASWNEHPWHRPAARNWNSWVSLLLFPDLLTQVAFVADLANLMELRFQPIDVTFFGLQKTLEQLP